MLSAHAGEIEGMLIPEGRMLLLDLTEFATREQFVYSRRWRVNGFVMWDNRSTMHRGRRFDPNEARDYQADSACGRRPDHLPVPKFSRSRPSCSAWALPSRAPPAVQPIGDS